MTKLEIPHIFIGFDEDEEVPQISELPPEVRQAADANVGIVICRIRCEWEMEENASRKLAYKQLRTGISLGHGPKGTTTLGAIVQNVDQHGKKFVGITSGHSVEKTSTSNEITQPVLANSEQTLAKLRESSAFWDQEIKMAKNHDSRYHRIIEKAKVDNTLKDMQIFI